MKIGDDGLPYFDETDCYPSYAMTMEYANKRLREWFKDHGIRITGCKGSFGWMMGNSISIADTHEAIMIGLKPIKKCEHKNKMYSFDKPPAHSRCVDCDARLEATGWKEVE